jgi:hypothetical protein
METKKAGSSLASSRIYPVAEKLFWASLRAKRSNPIHNQVNYFLIAASLTLLAMTARLSFSANRY